LLFKESTGLVWFRISLSSLKPDKKEERKALIFYPVNLRPEIDLELFFEGHPRLTAKI